MAWLAGYSKRKPITITGGASGAQTDFQIKLTVTYDGDMQSDFDDLRFTQADGQTLIDAWLETKADDVSATVWAEFPTTPANTVEQTYYMYYGKVVASDWDIIDTFIVGDDFEVAGAGDWTTVEGSPDYDNTTQAKSPTHSLQLDVGAAWESVTIPVTPSDDIAIDYWLYCDYLDRASNYDSWLCNHGNGTKRIVVIARNDLNLYYSDGTRHDTGINVVLDAWKSVSIYNIDWAAGTFTVEYDGNTANCDMQTSSADSGVIHMFANTASLYHDDVRVRKYAANPPTYVFGSEESESALRELITTIAAITSTSASDLNILRPLASTISTTTATNAIVLGFIRELTSTIASETTTSTIDFKVLREILATIAVTTSTSPPNVLMLRELISTIPATTSVSAVDVDVLRELISTIPATTLTSAADVNVLRELTSTIATATLLSEIELFTTTIRELVATIATFTSTSASALDVLRELVASIDATTSTSAATSAILREFDTSIATATSISSILLGFILELTTTIAAATSTSTSALDVVRALDATIATTTATTANIKVLRELSATIAVQSALSDIELLTKQLRELVTTIATVTSTSTPEMKVLRELEAIIEATTVLSAIELTILMWLTSNPTIKAQGNDSTIKAQGNDPFIK